MIPTPINARLKIVMDPKGRMRALYDGEPVHGITKIVCEQNGRNDRALVMLTFIGQAVCFETENPRKD